MSFYILTQGVTTNQKCSQFELNLLNPLTPKISIVILLTVYHTIYVMLIWRI